MYKQRPAYPALIGAVVVLCLGVAVTMNLIDQVNEGLREPRTVMMAGSVSVVLAGSMLIAAFARYQFTHLWKRRSPPTSKKHRNGRGLRR